MIYLQAIEKITNEELKLYTDLVKKDVKYGREGILINEAIRKNPLNEDKAIVAMKICLIDITNGTNLSRNLGKQGGLYSLSEKIVSSNFDERVKNGDLSIVEELSRWTKEKIGKNLFSFITKYCLYHNFNYYEKDDFAIYDSVICNNLHKYISKEDYYNITGKKLQKKSFTKLKDEYNYKEYMKIIDYIIKKNNITINGSHRKLDWYIWYKNR